MGLGFSRGSLHVTYHHQRLAIRFEIWNLPSAEDAEEVVGNVAVVEDIAAATTNGAALAADLE